jgi:integrase
MRIVNFRGKWCAYTREDGKPRRWSLGNLDATPENYPNAQRALADLQQSLAKPIGESINELVEAYLADTKAITRKGMDFHWANLKPHFGGLRADQITREKCRDYTTQRRGLGRKDGTIIKELTLMRTVINWAGKTGATWDIPSAPPSRDRWLTRGEFEKLIEAANITPHLKSFIHLAIATGARSEALLELTWGQVYFDRRQIWLGNKPGGKGRATVPMTDTLVAVLTASKKTALTNYVVEYAGEKITSIKKAFGRAVIRAGLTNVHPHDMRHTAAVWMASEGIPMTQIAQYLGHRDSRVTERVYARFAPDHLRNAAAALEVGI